MSKYACFLAKKAQPPPSFFCILFSTNLPIKICVKSRSTPPPYPPITTSHDHIPRAFLKSRLGGGGGALTGMWSDKMDIKYQNFLEKMQWHLANWFFTVSLSRQNFFSKGPKFFLPKMGVGWWFLCSLWGREDFSMVYHLREGVGEFNSFFFSYSYCAVCVV